jgi:hypothetical protein
MPKIRYANRRHDLRPKMSESLPYKGWKTVRVRKYAVAIQEVALRAWRSVPIVPYVVTTCGGGECEVSKCFESMDGILFLCVQSIWRA